MYENAAVSGLISQANSNVQFEKGSAATTYEPFYISSSTEVTLSENHTITAIWGPLVTADANGGTIPSTSGWTLGSGNTTATKPVKTGLAYGTLPIPTRSGYSFMGWNGKNKFTGWNMGRSIDLSTGTIGSCSDCALSEYIPVDFTNNTNYCVIHPKNCKKSQYIAVWLLSLQ